MTSEHITILEPNDLRAMRIVCKKCRASISVQLDETIRFPTECPLCREEWREAAYGNLTTAEALGRALKAWQSTERQDQQKYNVRFEVQTSST